VRAGRRYKLEATHVTALAALYHHRLWTSSQALPPRRVAEVRFAEDVHSPRGALWLSFVHVALLNHVCR
jgi:hypothetical protein